MTAITSLVSEDDLCGTAMLSLVSRGHVIINEILVLSKTVPSAFVSAEFHSVTTASADNKDYSARTLPAPKAMSGPFSSDAGMLKMIFPLTTMKTTRDLRSFSLTFGT